MVKYVDDKQFDNTCMYTNEYMYMVQKITQKCD